MTSPNRCRPPLTEILSQIAFIVGGLSAARYCRALFFVLMIMDNCVVKICLCTDFSATIG